jgi:putative endonuclease
MKQTANETGKQGEAAVCRYLVERGYTILARNYRLRGGEIDIIAKNEEFLAFVEVKTCAVSGAVSPLERISVAQQNRIIFTAMTYCAKHNADWALQPRYDAAAVTIAGGRVLSIEYLENAFDTSGLDMIL